MFCFILSHFDRFICVYIYKIFFFIEHWLFFLVLQRKCYVCFYPLRYFHTIPKPFDRQSYRKICFFLFVSRIFNHMCLQTDKRLNSVGFRTTTNGLLRNDRFIFVSFDRAIYDFLLNNFEFRLTVKSDLIYLKKLFYLFIYFSV